MSYFCYITTVFSNTYILPIIPFFSEVLEDYIPLILFAFYFIPQSLSSSDNYLDAFLLFLSFFSFNGLVYAFEATLCESLFAFLAFLNTISSSELELQLLNKWSNVLGSL